MAKKDEWDDDEDLDDKVLELIEKWDKNASFSDRVFITMHIIRKYARIRGIEYEESEDGLNKLRKMVVPTLGRTKAEDSKQQKDFFGFSIMNYGVVISLDEKDHFHLEKLSDKTLDIISKQEDFSDKELKKQIQQSRYPTVDAKMKLVEDDIDKQIEFMESQEDGGPIRPEKIEEMRMVLEGYEDAPDIYKMAKLLVYQAAKKQPWDQAEIERVLEEQVKEMVKDGKITGKEYSKIRKIVKRQHNKMVEV